MAFGTGLEDRIKITQQPQWQDNSIRLISGLAHNYRDAVRVPHGLAPVPGPAPGDRAPDALLTGEPRRRVFDLLRHPGFTLLASPGDSEQGQLAVIGKAFNEIRDRFPGLVATRLISQEPATGFDFDCSVPDTAGEFADQYSIGREGRLVLVRPDMYVGLSVAMDDAGRLAEYLDYWYQQGA
jgi:NADPH-dependent dioxygenase